MLSKTFILLSVLMIISCSENTLKKGDIEKISSPIQLDGQASEPDWQKTPWLPIDQNWVGSPTTKEDFNGRYKILWSEDALYVYAEIEDDTLVDTHEGLDRYWDDDCLEIFIDENQSGGNHQYNHNAFAYHLSLDGKVADIGPDSIAHYYPHVDYKVNTKGNISHWELAISIYDDTYQDSLTTNVPVKLSASKAMGFAIAYCDNDHSDERENFVGSIYVDGEDKNRGWIDASIFEKVTLNK